MNTAKKLMILGGSIIKPSFTISVVSAVGNIVTMKILASKEVSGFTVDDITISAGGTLDNFATVDNITFTVDWTLAAGANTMDIAAEVCDDLSGNKNVAATQYSLIYTTLTSSSIEDTYVYGYANPDDNYNNSSVLVLRAGTYERRAFMKFDLSSISGVIFSGKLFIYQATNNPSYQHIVNTHRILAANSGWKSAQATYNYAATNVRWAGDTGCDGGTDAGCSVSGTDYSATLFGTFTIAASSLANTEYAFNLSAAELALMLANNYGFVIVDTNGTLETVNIYSRESITDGFRPKMELVYNPN